jgi:hypothetical protein
MAPRRSLAHALPYASVRMRCRMLPSAAVCFRLLPYATVCLLPELGSIRQRRRSAASVCCRSFRSIGSGASSIRHTLLIRHTLYNGTAGWHKKSRRAGCLLWLSSIRQHTSQHTSACQSAYVSMPVSIRQDTLLNWRVRGVYVVESLPHPMSLNR